MDNLEDFIKKNKGEFDSKTPSPDLWNRIKEEREEEKVIPIATGKRAGIPMQIMRVAASFLILALAAFGGYQLLNDSNNEMDNEVTLETSNLPTELVELDQYYESQVTVSLTQINLIISDTSILNEVKSELKMLDDEKGKLFSEYGKEMDDQQIVEALMNTYRMKLQVLENILSLLNENENEADLSI
ncbi:MAG: hypothetical protein COA58_11865 [Bacteroidetes bacterium]|nr:MAG: hypothetical protein COA58_11865 [Bacteroidota bacterium]